MVEKFNKEFSANPCYPYIIKWPNSRQRLIRYELSSIAIKDDYPGEIYEDDYEQFDVFWRKNNFNMIQDCFKSAYSFDYSLF